MTDSKNKKKPNTAAEISAKAASAVSTDDHNHAVHEHEHSHECCAHCCHDGGEHESSLKAKCFRLVFVVILFAAAIFFPNFSFAGKSSAVLRTVLFAAAYLIAGGDVLLGAVKNIIRGKIFDENFLMSIATVGAFAIGEYPECIGVMVFYQIGEAFQDYAIFRFRHY